MRRTELELKLSLGALGSSPCVEFTSTENMIKISSHTEPGGTFSIILSDRNLDSLRAWLDQACQMRLSVIKGLHDHSHEWG